MAERPRYIHTVDDMDEYGDMITSSDTDGRHPLDPSTPLMAVDDHLQRFSNHYAQIKQKYTKPVEELSPKLKGDISQEIDFAVCKAMEKLVIASPHLSQRVQSLAPLACVTTAPPATVTNETLLADAIKTVELLTGCATSPAPAHTFAVQPLMTNAPLTATPTTAAPVQQTHVQMARPTATLRPYDNQKESLDTFLARFDNFVNYFKWTEEDKLFYLRNNLGPTEATILSDGGAYTTVPELITLLQNRFGTSTQSERFRIELNARRRRPNESLQALYLDIKRLAKQAYQEASAKTLDLIGIEKFANALTNKELRRHVLLHDCSTLDEALHVALRVESIDITPVYDSEGFRRNSTAVRSVTVDDIANAAHGDPNARSDLTYWNSRTPSVAFRQPSVMGDGLSSISGVSHSASYQAPPQQYA